MPPPARRPEQGTHPTTGPPRPPVLPAPAHLASKPRPGASVRWGSWSARPSPCWLEPMW